MDNNEPGSSSEAKHSPQPTLLDSSSASSTQKLANYDVGAATAALLAKIPTHDDQGQPLSKNAIKRLRKQAHLDALKPLRRAKEKQQKKERAQTRKKLITEGKLAAPEKKRRAERAPFGAKVVIDCGFDEMMNEKEVKSMVAQLGYCYSTNRSSTRPFDMLITSFNARLRQKFDAIDGKPHQNWRGVEWWDDPWDQLWATDEVDAKTGQSQHAHTSTEPSEGQTDPDIYDVTLNTNPDPPQSTPQKPSRVPQTSIVYLTGDSPNVLDTLTPGETYVLGGIVDHNRYKHLCLDRAERAGVRHAQLPIAEHMPALRTRKVLTVNQVYSILVNYAETQSWSAALEAVMPQRKLVDGSTHQPVVGIANDDALVDDEGTPLNDEEDSADGGTRVTQQEAESSLAVTDKVNLTPVPTSTSNGARAGSKQAKRRRAKQAAVQALVRNHDGDDMNGVYVVREGSSDEMRSSQGNDDDDVEAVAYEARAGPVPEAVVLALQAGDEVARRDRSATGVDTRV